MDRIVVVCALLLGLFASAIAINALAEEVAGVDLCAFARTATEAELLSADPLDESPCDAWDPSMWDEATRTCTYTCGATVHVEAM